MTYITELAQSLKAAAEKAGIEQWVNNRGEVNTADYEVDGGVYIDHICNCEIAGTESPRAEFIALANPANILALVEALENTRNENELARGQLLIAGRTLLNQQAKIAELESSGIAPGILRCSECSFVETKNIISVTADTITTGNSEPEPCPNGCGQLQPVNWKALAIQLMFTTRQGVSDLLEAKKRIAELEEAEQKLCAANVTLDARAELAERRLAEMESRTVTIEPFRSFVTDADLAALHRFAECCDDPESGGHDLEQEQVRRLEAIGALQRSGRISYITGFGDVLISITAGIKWEAE
ncbi:TPA: ead/Ea22-like family protein [Klebsiella oxytoca]|nr:ead/Ea22-like family protein [Klebsiella oxytoca]